jgi:hypothetical protein
LLIGKASDILLILAPLAALSSAFFSGLFPFPLPKKSIVTGMRFRTPQRNSLSGEQNG